MCNTYGNLAAFLPRFVFNIITISELTSVTVMSGGINDALGGNLADSAFELPSAPTTTFSGHQLNPSMVFLLTLFVAYGGVGLWTRYFLPSGVATTDLKYRFEQVKPMLCSLFGVPLDLIQCSNYLSASVNNFSHDPRHSAGDDHVWQFLELICLFLNITEDHFACLRQVWVMAIEGTLEALRFKHDSPEAYKARVAAHTESLLADKEWLNLALRRAQASIRKDASNGRQVVDRSLGDRVAFARWFRKKGAVCDNSLMLTNRFRGPFTEHFDRCCDDLTHTPQNTRVVCMCFRSAFNPSREQWLTLLLGQDLVPLTDDDRTLVRKELAAIAAGGNMTRKHHVRTHGENGVAATADDNRFAR